MEVPHCFNAFDSVDPDGPYYQGPGWYRARVEVTESFSCTAAHFCTSKARDKRPKCSFILKKSVRMSVATTNSSFDITDQVNKCPKISDQIAPLPVAVMCDNSRDLEMIPSNLSDFNLYGGLYRYVNLRLRAGNFSGARARRAGVTGKRKSEGHCARPALQSF